MSDEVGSLDTLEEKKVTELRIAQSKAEQLFHEVGARGLIRAGLEIHFVDRKRRIGGFFEELLTIA